MFSLFHLSLSLLVSVDDSSVSLGCPKPQSTCQSCNWKQIDNTMLFISESSFFSRFSFAFHYFRNRLLPFSVLLRYFFVSKKNPSSHSSVVFPLSLPFSSVLFFHHLSREIAFASGTSVALSLSFFKARTVFSSKEQQFVIWRFPQTSTSAAWLRVGKGKRRKVGVVKYRWVKECCVRLYVALCSCISSWHLTFNVLLMLISWIYPRHIKEEEEEENV